ncbi:MAG TPA: hypothetical protein VKE74_12485 [Gemmataceae bacterium]|nr:hypothetical protein [Gemmataceae bacterium]
MVIPAPASLEVRNADGQVVAYIVPAEQMSRLRAEVESLREQLAEAIWQRDHHLAKREELLKTWAPLPPTEEKLLAAVPNSDEIQKLIADLESR